MKPGEEATYKGRAFQNRLPRTADRLIRTKKMERKVMKLLKWIQMIIYRPND